MDVNSYLFCNLQKYSLCAIVCLCSIGLMYILVDSGLDSIHLKGTGQILLSLRDGHGDDERPWQTDHLNAGANFTIGENVTKRNTPVGKYSTKRGRRRAKADGAWVGTKNPIEIYAYSAFFDDRTSLMSLPVVRIIIVTEANDSSTLYCFLRYGDRKQGHLITAKRLGM